MFDKSELIRIYFAAKKDLQEREESEFRYQYAEEILLNKSIMAKIRKTGLIRNG